MRDNHSTQTPSASLLPAEVQAIDDFVHQVGSSPPSPRPKEAPRNWWPTTTLPLDGLHIDYSERIPEDEDDQGLSTFALRFDPPLDLGLRLTTQGTLQDFLEQLLGPRDIQTGDEHFDTMRFIEGDEPERIQAFLSAPVRAALLQIESPLTDRGWDLTLPPPYRGPVGPGFAGLISGPAEWIAEQRRRLASHIAIAHLLDAARAAVPPPGLLRETVDAWLPFAERYGLRLQRTPLRLQGEVERLPVQVDIHRVERGRFTATLQLRWTVTSDFFRGLDRERDALLEQPRTTLAARGFKVTMDRHAITATCDLHAKAQVRPSELLGHLQTLIEAVQRVAAHADERHRQGPYR